MAVYSLVRRLVPCHLTGYTLDRDPEFQTQRLERFFLTGSKAGVQVQQAERLRLLLGQLNAATSPEDMRLPGLGLHQLKGDRKGAWAVSASGNWRVTFTSIGKDADDVDYEDYH